MGSVLRVEGEKARFRVLFFSASFPRCVELLLRHGRAQRLGGLAGGSSWIFVGMEERVKGVFVVERRTGEAGERVRGGWRSW